MRITQTRTSIRNSASVLFIIGATALAATSCSSGSPDGDAKPTPAQTASSAPASQKSSDPQAAGKQDVLETYKRFWAEQTKAYAQASITGTDLKKYATADALADAEGDIASLKRLGVVASGKPEIAPKVTGLTLSKKVPAATITDCLDVSHWRRIEEKTGKEVPRGSETLSRYATTVQAERWGEQWMILKVTPQQHAC